MRVRGAELIVRALEDEGVRFTFGIPGTHNIELYDSLERSETVAPILVTDEQSASFMADGVARSTGGVGVVNVVPGAGVTHALSGIAEAFVDNIPLVVLACGIRTDTGKAYQLHAIDQAAVLRPVTKTVLTIQRAEDLYDTVRRAFRLTRAGPPGPVAVEVPANLLMLTQEAPEPDRDQPPLPEPRGIPTLVEDAVQLLQKAENPALYVGHGARGAADLLPALAEALGAPVTTTFQGKGVFPESHPLWLWNGFGPQAPPFVRKVMDRCDVLLAIGVRFGEVATGSYGLTPPPALIHVDVDPDVFDRNVPTRIALRSDARLLVQDLLDRLEPGVRRPQLEADISNGHAWLHHERERNRSEISVTPGALFSALSRHAPPGTIYATDSGNGTFLALENLRLDSPGCFLAPVDYSCMGYAVPAAIGAKLACPDRDVIALPGDGALLMTGLELLTAATCKAAPLVCVLHDGELGQIAQFQRTALNRGTCTVLPSYSLEGLAATTGCLYEFAGKDEDLETVLPRALTRTREGLPVLVDVKIDYSKKTWFTRGVVATNFWRFSWPERLRMVSRILARRLGSEK